MTVEHSILVYEGYEAIESLEVGEPCITVGDINPIRPGNRLIVWDESGESIVTSGEITGGTIEYDLSGPQLDDGGNELFYFCSFGVLLEDLPRDGAFRFEYPGAEELSGTIAAQDLRGGAQTTYTDADFESERQRIRAEQ